MVATRIPLIRLDAGWLFIIAGLALCIGCVMVSGERELQNLRVQQSLLHAEEQTAYARIRAHESFLEQLDEPSDSLTRRLAAAELNLMPASDRPVLRMVSFSMPTIEWIDAQVVPVAPQPVRMNRSTFAELVTGTYRLWVFGGGVLCVFAGLLLDSSISNARYRKSLRAAADEGSGCVAIEEPASEADSGTVVSLLEAPAPLANHDEMPHRFLQHDALQDHRLDDAADALLDDRESVEDEALDRSAGNASAGQNDRATDRLEDIEAEGDAEKLTAVEEASASAGDDRDSLEALLGEGEEYDEAEIIGEVEIETSADDPVLNAAEDVFAVRPDAQPTIEGDCTEIDARAEDQGVRVDDSCESKPVISIRPPMSIAPPDEDDVLIEDSLRLIEPVLEGESQSSSLFDALDEPWVDDCDDSGADDEPKRSHGKSARGRHRKPR